MTAMLFAAFYSGGGGKGVLHWGCFAGTAAALLLAVLRRTTALINLGVWGAWTMAFAFLAEILFMALFWTKKAPGADPGGAGTRVFNRTAAALCGALLFYALPPVFLIPPDFLLAGMSFFNTEFLFKCAGYAAGLLVVFITALAFFKIASGVSRTLLGLFISILITITALEQLTAIIRLLFARRVIPMNRQLFRIIILAVNNEIVFLLTQIAVSAVLVVVCFANSARGKPPSGGERRAGSPPSASAGEPNPAERRKEKAARRNRRRWCVTAAAGCAAAILSLTALKTISERAVELSPAEAMTISGGEIIIPASQVEDGHLHRFAFMAEDGTEVRFIVVKKSAASYGVGLDACDICGATGYYERKDGIVCRLCDVVMNKSTIGFKGGCNPVPLAYTMREGSMIIKVDDLENEKKRFQ
ncbi:MAG: Fe-S-containing protein [Treponema sp.]|nr:Fe-S-containing protein [Treponema sp.]